MFLAFGPQRGLTNFVPMNFKNNDPSSSQYRPKHNMIGYITFICTYLHFDTGSTGSLDVGHSLSCGSPKGKAWTHDNLQQMSIREKFTAISNCVDGENGTICDTECYIWRINRLISCLLVETRVSTACRVTIVSDIRSSNGCIPFWVDFELKFRRNIYSIYSGPHAYPSSNN